MLGLGIVGTIIVVIVIIVPVVGIVCYVLGKVILLLESRKAEKQKE